MNANQFFDAVFEVFDEQSFIEALKNINRVADNQSPYSLHKIILKSKKYEFDETLEIQNLTNVMIEGNNAQLIWKKQIRAMHIKNCRNITFEDFSIDYNPVPYIQGVIKRSEGQHLEVLTDEGYPNSVSIFNSDSQIFLCLHDAKTLAPLPGSNSTYYVSNVAQISENIIEANLLRSYDCYGSKQPENGDIVSLYQRGIRTVLIEKSSSLTFEKVNMYSSPGFGLTEWDSKGGTVFNNCCFVPGPKPISATRNRTRSINADAFHFASNEKGPIFDSCKITHCGDDCINVHGSVYFVVEVNGKELFLSSKYLSKVESGATVNAFRNETFKMFGSAEIIEQETVIRSDLSDKVAYLYADSCGGHASDVELQRVVLDKEICGIEYGDSIIPITHVGNGTIIKNCKLGYNRARALLIKGDNVVIENNTVAGCTDSAFLLFMECAWQEGGFLTNLVVRNNNISDCCCGIETLIGKNECVADIVVGSSKQKNGEYRENYENKNILITNNNLNNSGKKGIFVSNASDVCIKGNTINNPYNKNKTAEYDLSAIEIQKSKNVDLDDNRIINNLKQIELYKVGNNSVNINTDSYFLKNC